ncbi:hypothetical protein POM88_024659 [Heracleum sosnowskyi]|uniref:Uncharacterized protein n=1 Tax=Heracleum sosnowskyi TaxID=360622 RepID=A0AAD8I3E7_9APIA|nr:hypothetical protein POM88_024659 [Heracleum sosnowskyi]
MDITLQKRGRPKKENKAQSNVSNLEVIHNSGHATVQTMRKRGQPRKESLMSNISIHDKGIETFRPSDSDMVLNNSNHDILRNVYSTPYVHNMEETSCNKFATSITPLSAKTNLSLDKRIKSDDGSSLMINTDRSRYKSVTFFTEKITPGMKLSNVHIVLLLLMGDELYVSNVAATRFYINHRSVGLMKQRAILPDFKVEPLMRNEPEKIQIMTISDIRILGPTFILTSAQYSTSGSLTKNTFKTPDTRNSTNTKKLKRTSNEDIASITTLDDDNDGDEHQPRFKKKLPLKQVKIEKKRGRPKKENKAQSNVSNLEVIHNSGHATVQTMRKRGQPRKESLMSNISIHDKGIETFRPSDSDMVLNNSNHDILRNVYSTPYVHNMEETSCNKFATSITPLSAKTNLSLDKRIKSDDGSSLMINTDRSRYKSVTFFTEKITPGMKLSNVHIVLLLLMGDELYVSNVAATHFYINHRSVGLMKQRAILPDFKVEPLMRNEPEKIQIMTISDIRILGPTFILTSAQYSTSGSLTKNTFKTPDTRNSTNTKKLKRTSNEDIASITTLDDDNDGDEHQPRFKKKLPLKQVKIEKVN